MEFYLPCQAQTTVTCRACQRSYENLEPELSIRLCPSCLESNLVPKPSKAEVEVLTETTRQSKQSRLLHLSWEEILVSKGVGAGAIQKLTTNKIVSMYALWQQTPKSLSMMGIKVQDIVKLRSMTVLPEDDSL
jgi:hypothetical protein